MECPSCEAEVTDGSRFCPFCGVHLAAGNDRTERTATADPTVEVRSASERRPGPDRGSDLLSCPRCSAPNSPHRVLCGRCGADLGSGDTGIPPRPSPRAPAPTDTGEPDQGGPPARRSWIVVVVLGALVGSAIGLVVWLRAGADGSADEPRPSFDPVVYADDPQPLDISRVAASSQLAPEGSISYEPALAVDGDPTTAWNEGAEGSGEGERLQLELADDSWVRRIVIRNGYQKDGRSFFDNARAARVLLRFDEVAYVVDLADQTGEQAVTLPEPALTRTVTVEIVEAIPGNQYEDLAISEIRVIGWPGREAARSG